VQWWWWWWFAQLRPVIEHYFTHETEEEMNDFLYGMNLIVNLLCELSHRVGEKQQWNPRACTSYATLLELLHRDTLEVVSMLQASLFHGPLRRLRL
jgi:hypothetical protein